MDSIGFIILRHVNSAKTNIYWQMCYDCVRRFYPENPIVIIDDNSNPAFLTQKTLYKTNIVQSVFPKRGELLPYLYLLKYRYFETAVVLHDSVFINKWIDFRTDKYKFFWTFEHIYDRVSEEEVIVRSFHNTDLLDFFKNKWGWSGCFGAMAVVNTSFLMTVNAHFNFGIFIGLITNRTARMCFERVFAMILQYVDGKQNARSTRIIFGDIHQYCPYGIPFELKTNYSHLPITKVWSGR